MSNHTHEYFLTTPAAILREYVFSSDRDYFAKPIPVELIDALAAGELVDVRDARRGKVYRVASERVKTYSQLNRVQRITRTPQQKFDFAEPQKTFNF